MTYRSRRATRRLARKSKNRFLITVIIVIFLIYATLAWILPAFIGSVGFVTNIIKPAQKPVVQTSQNAALAPPILSIPFEATNSSQIDIKGFGTPDSKVRLYIDGELNETTDVGSDGSFTFQNISLNLGINNIYGTTLDDQDKQSLRSEDLKESLPSKTIRLIFDNQKPPLSINEPEDNKQIQGGDRKIKISGKTESGVKVFINGTQVIVDKDGNFSSEQQLNDGDNIFTIKAIDAASNSAEIQRKVTYTP